MLIGQQRMKWSIKKIETCQAHSGLTWKSTTQPSSASLPSAPLVPLISCPKLCRSLSVLIFYSSAPLWKLTLNLRFSPVPSKAPHWFPSSSCLQLSLSLVISLKLPKHASINPTLSSLRIPHLISPCPSNNQAPIFQTACSSQIFKIVSECSPPTRVILSFLL